MQRALMHYFKPYNRELVLKALRKAGREDLIGFGKDCLIAPRPIEKRSDRKDDRKKPPRRDERKASRPTQPRKHGR